jgi:hypothetical protein
MMKAARNSRCPESPDGLVILGICAPESLKEDESSGGDRDWQASTIYHFRNKVLKLRFDLGSAR